MMALVIGLGGYMKQEIEFVSPSMGKAVLVLLSWGDEKFQASHIQFFQKGISRLEALEHGADLMGWFDSLASDSPSDLPFDWCVVSSFLEEVH